MPETVDIVSFKINVQTFERRIRKQLRKAFSADRPMRGRRRRVGCGGRFEGLHDDVLDVVECAALHPFADERFEFGAVNFNRHGTASHLIMRTPRQKTGAGGNDLKGRSPHRWDAQPRH